MSQEISIEIRPVRTLGAIIEDMTRTNLELWRMEDEARSTDDQRVAMAKRHITDLNNHRNHLIEQYDEALGFLLSRVPR